MLGFPEAYLDIETTGLYPDESSITVIGIYFCNLDSNCLVQLYGNTVTSSNLLTQLSGTECLYTYNGERFDLPFIRARLGPDLRDFYTHNDIMHDCHRHNLKGGLKAVLRNVGISRETDGVTGYDAIRLWYQYKQDNNLDALDLLLRYNRDDVVNLKQLKDYLHNKEQA